MYALREGSESKKKQNAVWADQCWAMVCSCDKWVSCFLSLLAEAESGLSRMLEDAGVAAAGHR